MGTRTDEDRGLHRRESASYRDPAGFVFHADGRIRRAVTEYGLAPYRAVRATGLIDRLIASGALLPEKEIATELEGQPDVRLVLEHPRLPFVSYPYEWPFRALRAAALLHLDVQLESLDAGVMLTDATAYNVQFVGARPVFIDHLAFRPYRDGELWAGRHQFCEQFLHPLLLQSLLGIPFQSWYRGRLDGVPGDEVAHLLRWRHRLQWNVFTNVVLPARLQRLAGRRAVERRVARARMPRAALREMLVSLRAWIARIEPRGLDRTTWAAYDATVPGEEAQAIAAFVDEFVRRVMPRTLWDLGCNAGRYGEVALAAGAGYVVGLDSDAGALDRAFARAQDRGLALLPLLVDLVNPSPSQGWRGVERESLAARGPADALLAIAVIHHLAIARNVPLEEIVELFTGLAPEGVVGFVPPADARAQALFRGREEIFRAYTLENFLARLQSRARIVRQQPLPGGHRVLVWYSTR
ncbi:MAG: class I SAM-dependent methyltransferase [Acidobacteria bacterium]|nr:class I SAM-dependent methyltransferase [Acidobacteriota bacterium]